MSKITVISHETGYSSAIEGIAADNSANIFAAYGSGNIIKIDVSGNVSFLLSTGFLTRGIAVANGYLFACNLSTDKEVHMYNATSGAHITSVILTGNISNDTTYPFGICTDWTGSGSTFNCYVSHANNPTLSYFSVNGTTLTYQSAIQIDSSNPFHLCTFRQYNSTKYVYCARSDSISEFNVSSFSYIGDINVTIPGGELWGISWVSKTQKFYVSIYNGFGIHSCTIAGQSGGSITSLSSLTLVANGQEGHTPTDTTITNGTSATDSSNYLQALSIATNTVNSTGTNIFSGTSDRYVVKIYPTSGSGVGGDPHIQPIIGKQYTLDNSITYCRLYEYLDKDKIIINGKSWFLPDEELKKYERGNEKIHDTMINFTYFKYVYIYCNGEELYLDIDSLEPVEYFEQNELCNKLVNKIHDNYDNNSYNRIILGNIEQLKSMFSIRLQRFMKEKYCKQVLSRKIIIRGNEMIVTLNVTSNLLHSDRNSMTIEITNFDENDVRHKGALIRESDATSFWKLNKK